MLRPRGNGFTLIELLIVLAVLVILVAMAAPSFVETLEKRRLINATQSMTALIQQARSLAVARNTRVSFVINRDSGTGWCFGLTDKHVGGVADCTCAEGTPRADACTVALTATISAPDDLLIRTDQSSLPGVALAPVGAVFVITFEPTRGLRVDNSGSPSGGNPEFTFESQRRGLQTRIEVNALGRIRTCSPSGATLLGGVEPC